jgi:methyl-accepting chemotaxis protein
MEGLHGLRAELSFAIAQLAVLRDQSAGSSERVDAVGERTIRRFEDAMSTIGSRLSELEQAVKSGTQRIEKMEQSLDSLDQAAAEVRDSVTRDLLNFERAFKQQAAAIESTRTAVSQTDDLVERVVEALESLQGVIMERAESNELPAARAS